MNIDKLIERYKKEYAAWINNNNVDNREVRHELWRALHRHNADIAAINAPIEAARRCKHL